MRTVLTNTARAADLTGASNRSVAKLVNTVLEDLNVISKEDPTKVVDKNKIRRELSKKRKEHQTLLKNRIIEGLYFDRRKDQTIAQVNGRRIVNQEEHISIIQEPGNN